MSRIVSTLHHVLHYLLVMLAAGAIIRHCSGASAFADLAPEERAAFHRCATTIASVYCAPPVEGGVGMCMMFEEGRYARRPSPEARARWLREMGCAPKAARAQ